MRIGRIFSILFFLFCISANSQNLREETKVSLITCGPGTELYSIFGHSALHIYDPALGLDRVYNYGTFDFDTPNFYVKFSRGKLDYFLNITNYPSFIYSYEREGRWVYNQELNLSLEQKTKIFNFLENNALPQNKYYQYDFFYDNCSTRLRDVLEEVLGDELVYPEISGDKEATTFRELIEEYLVSMPWSDLGIDLALGLPCDKEADFREMMFLPDYLKDNLQTAILLNDSGERPLVSSQGLVLAERIPEELRAKKRVNWIFWILLVFALLTGYLVSPKKMAWFDVPFFVLSGLLGVFILLLWFATDHSATKWNLNVLWALPSWLYGAFLLIAKRINRKFFKIHAIVTFTIMVFWIVIPQSYHQAVIPITLALAARSWSWQKLKFNVSKDTHAA